jgi:FkbM family methyltransferase
MNFSSLSNKSVLGKLARLPLRLLPRDWAVPVLQGPIRGWRWVVGSATHGEWLGSYELAKQRRFTTVLQPGHVVYDIGANVGFYSLVASKLVGPGGRVYAFEPLPRNLAYLQRHVELNGASNVEVMPVAVGAAAGIGYFEAHESAAMGKLSTRGIPTQVVAIDELTLPPPDVIKMDIEGGEVDALAGMRRTLAKHKPVIFLATHAPDLHTRCLTQLRELGYRIETIDGGPIETADEIVAFA